MVITVSVMALIGAMSIPSAITGFCFWLIQRKINKRDEKDKEDRTKRQKILDEREATREKNELYISSDCIISGIVSGGVPGPDGLEAAACHLVDDFWMHDSCFCCCPCIHGRMGTPKGNLGKNRV